MKAATIHEIKKELEALESEQVKALCLRLAKFKKDNKELLTYLLFEAQDEQEYIANVKQEIDDQFLSLSNNNVYYIKKSLRRTLRVLNKQIKYSGLATTDLELRIYFCQKIKGASIPLDRSSVLLNLYKQQHKKINQALAKLDEDLQYDYQSQIEGL